MIALPYRACAIAWLAMLAAGPAAARSAAPSLDPSSCAKPVYPKAALRAEQQGTVTLGFRLDAQGKVLESRVVTSSGVALLDTTAQSAFEKCRFRAPKPNADAWQEVKYVWSLEGDSRPVPPLPEPFVHAPAPMRAFLQQARKADAIADPLQRCLALPDMPGNQWAPGLARAYCELLFGEVITRPTAAGHIDGGTVAALDALYRRDLERHFSKDDFSEIIHRDFQQFGGDEETERLTASWLKQAPDSPFAHLFRGAYLADLASTARGGRWAQETPAEDLRRMSELAAQGLELYATAIRLEPRLMT